MRIFVINLLRRPDRLEAISRDLQMHGLAFEIIEAIDARSDSLILPNRRPWLKKTFGKNPYSDGAIACFLSHRAIWKHMVENNISQALVLEDDAIIKLWDKRILDVDVASLGLDFLRLGVNVEPDLTTSQYNVLKASILDRQLLEGVHWGTVASVTTNAGARKMLKLEKYWFPADDFKSFEKSLGVKSAVISPMIWGASGSNSDIHLTKKKAGRAQSLVLLFTKPLRRNILLPAIHLYLRLVTSRH